MPADPQAGQHRCEVGSVDCVGWHLRRRSGPRAAVVQVGAMTYTTAPAAAVTALLHVVMWSLVLRAGLGLWLDCGKACGAAAKPAQASAERPRAGR